MYVCIYIYIYINEDRQAAPVGTQRHLAGQDKRKENKRNSRRVSRGCRQLFFIIIPRIMVKEKTTSCREGAAGMPATVICYMAPNKRKQQNRKVSRGCRRLAKIHGEKTSARYRGCAGKVPAYTTQNRCRHPPGTLPAPSRYLPVVFCIFILAL